MRKLSRLAAGSVIAAATALGGASVALADGYSPKRVAYERPADWSGVYFGVGSGYQWSGIDQTFTAYPVSVTYEHDAAIVSAHIGLQHQFGNVVLGAEAGWLSTLRDDPARTGDPCHVGGFFCTNRLNDILTVGARVGWAAGHWMPYVTGGYASGRFAYEEITTATGVKFADGSTRHGGWYVGAGFEWIVSPGWTTGLEYRHYDFGERSAIPNTPAGAPVGVDIYTQDATVDTITARVSWRWGREAAAPLK